MDKKEELTQIVKIVQKDKEQFELLYSHVVKKVYFWCYNIIDNEVEAKDVTQEVMIRVYRKLDTLKTAETFNSWLYSVTRNCCFNYLRTNKKREREYLYSEDYNDSSETLVKEERIENLPQDAYALKEIKGLINKFVNQLPQRQKEVVTLFYLEEMKISEIAEALDYNSSSVRTCLHAGRKNLEKKITEYQEKNNVKLCGVILIPMLKVIMEEYREKIWIKQDLSYKGNTYYSSQMMNGEKLITLISGKSIIAISIACIGIIIALIMVDNTSNEMHKSIASTDGLELDETMLHSSLNEDSELFLKLKGNSYIESINYLTFPVRTEVGVLIELKEAGISKKIEIYYNDKSIPIEKNGNQILFNAKENGNYTILVDNREITFKINKIDPYAPEVTGIKNYDTYLQILANDELSQINYDKSYLIKDGQEYKITKELKVHGEFQGFIQLVIYDNDGFYIGYSIDID